jgi:hypothetical protein
VGVAEQALLEAREPELDALRLDRVKAVAGCDAQAPLELAGVLAQAPRLALADQVAAVEPFDAALQVVDAGLQAADMAPVGLLPVAVAVALPVGVGRGRRRGIILGRGGRRESESRSGGGERNKDFTHHGSPSELG